MDATLNALGGILLKAVPTFLLVVLLHFYLKHMFFKPLDKVLHERYEATEGARRRAEESIERAAARAGEYEAAMRTARAEVYQQQEELHRKLQEERDREVAAARQRAEAAVKEARRQLQAEVEQAKASLAGESDRLAAEIAKSILSGRVA